MAEVPDEIKDLQSSVALNMLTDLFKQGKISQEQCDLNKKKFQRLHDTIVQTFQNHKVLWQKAKKLKTELTNQKQALEDAVTKQAEAQERAQQLNANLKKAEAEYEIFEHKIDVLSFEYDDLDHEKTNKLMKIQEEEKEARNKIAPELERLDNEIESLKDDVNKRKTLIENEQRHLTDQTERIASLKKENDDQLNDISKLHDEMLKIKDDPVRFAKNADMLSSANTVMLQDLQHLLEDIGKKDSRLKDQTSEINHLNMKLKEYQTQLDQEKDVIDQCNSQMKKYHEDFARLREEQKQLKADQIKHEIELRTSQKEIRRHNDIINSLKKLIDQDKKAFKKEQHQKNMLRDQIFEQKMIIDKYEKEEQEFKYEMDKQSDIQINLNEENILLEGKQKQVQEKTSEKQNERNLIQKQIDELEKQLVNLQEFEQEALKQVKALTAMRESMARKASSALAEVRETREELKIKELLILDLTKKYQETEFKLNNYKALYEEVKSARNKYVNLIQNSSQDLAELKERIKILQNELEILKNESQEKVISSASKNIDRNAL